MGLKGKAIGELLQRIKLSKIDGEIQNREQEIEFVKDFLESYFIER